MAGKLEFRQFAIAVGLNPDGSTSYVQSNWSRSSRSASWWRGDVKLVPSISQHLTHFVARSCVVMGIPTGHASWSMWRVWRGAGGWRQKAQTLNGNRLRQRFRNCWEGWGWGSCGGGTRSRRGAVWPSGGDRRPNKLGDSGADQKSRR